MPPFETDTPSAHPATSTGVARTASPAAPSTADIAAAVAANTAAITRLIDRQAMAENAIMQHQNRLDMSDMAASIRELSTKIDRLTGPAPAAAPQRPGLAPAPGRTGARPVRPGTATPAAPVAPRPQRPMPGTATKGGQAAAPPAPAKSGDADQDDGGRKWI